jgi:hypothetical protein
MTTDGPSTRQAEIEFIERHQDADLIYDTKRGRVVSAIYPPWHPWGVLQRFFLDVPITEDDE